MTTEREIHRRPDQAGRPEAVKGYQRDAARTIVRIEPGQRQQFTILSPALVGVWTHYVGETRTYPCLGRPQCHFDHETTSLRWQGWLQVCKPGMRRSLYAPITFAAVRDECLLRAHAGKLRGRTMYLSRSGHSIRSRQFAIIGMDRTEYGELPEAVDLRAWLIDLWGMPSSWPAGVLGVRGEPLRLEEVEWDDDPIRRVESREK